MKIFKLIKDNWLTALLLTGIVILLISKFNTKPEKIDNSGLISQIDLLKNVIIQKAAADSAEKHYLQSVDSIENNKNTILIRLRKNFEKKDVAIKKLTMDQQIAFFKSEVFADGTYPLAEIKNGDSIVTVSAAQFLETNVMFNERNYLYDLKDTLDSELSKSYDLLTDSKKVISLKNQQIGSMDLLNSQNNLLIENLNKTIKEERKAKNWGIVKASVIGGLVGVGVGIFIMK